MNKFFISIIISLFISSFSNAEILGSISDYGELFNLNYDYSGKRYVKTLFPSKLPFSRKEDNYLFYGYEYDNIVHQKRGGHPYITSDSYSRREGLSLILPENYKIYLTNSESSMFFNWYALQNMSSLSFRTKGNSYAISKAIVRNFNAGFGFIDSKTLGGGVSRYITKNMTFFNNEPFIAMGLSFNSHFYDSEFKSGKFTFYSKLEKREDLLSFQFFDNEQRLSFPFLISSTPKLISLDFKLNKKVVIGLGVSTFDFSHKSRIMHYYPKFNIGDQIGFINLSSKSKSYSLNLEYVKSTGSSYKFQYRRCNFDLLSSGRISLQTLAGGFFQVFGGGIIDFSDRLDFNHNVISLNWEKRLTKKTDFDLSLKMIYGHPEGYFANGLYTFFGMVPVSTNFKNLTYEKIKIYNLSVKLKRTIGSFNVTYNLSQSIPIAKKQKTITAVGEIEKEEKMKKTTQGGRTHNLEVTYFF